jgi:hypothetical protein
MAMAVQLQTGKNVFKTVLEQAHVLSVLPHFAAVSLDPRQPNTLPSIAAIFQQPGMLSGTTRGIYQTSSNFSQLIQAYRKSPSG